VYKQNNNLMPLRVEYDIYMSLTNSCSAALVIPNSNPVATLRMSEVDSLDRIRTETAERT
jgi:hypothetical protein